MIRRLKVIVSFHSRYCIKSPSFVLYWCCICFIQGMMYTTLFRKNRIFCLIYFSGYIKAYEVKTLCIPSRASRYLIVQQILYHYVHITIRDHPVWKRKSICAWFEYLSVPDQTKRRFTLCCCESDRSMKISNSQL